MISFFNAALVNRKTVVLVHRRKHTRRASAAMVLRHRALAVVEKLKKKGTP